LFIFQAFTTNLGYWEGIWLGANDLARKGRFVWKATGQRLSYANWVSGQPSRGINERCLHMISGDKGKWDDIICDDEFQMTMCEIVQ